MDTRSSDAEVGKTVLSSKIVRLLTDELQLKTGAIETTGTGGRLDSLEHQRAGAYAIADQVDAGLITTCIDKESFRKCMCSATAGQKGLRGSVTRQCSRPCLLATSL